MSGAGRPSLRGEPSAWQVAAELRRRAAEQRLLTVAVLSALVVVGLLGYVLGLTERRPSPPGIKVGTETPIAGRGWCSLTYVGYSGTVRGVTIRKIADNGVIANAPWDETGGNVVIKCAGALLLCTGTVDALDLHYAPSPEQWATSRYRHQSGCGRDYTQ